MTQPPLPVPDPDVEALVFRCKFLHYWIATSFAGLACSFPILFLISSHDQILQRIVVWVSIPSGFIASSVITVVLIIIAPVKVDADRLRGTGFWGKSAQVGWQDISSVKRINYFTLPYIKISTHRKKNIIWLPLFLADPQGLRDAVANFTSPDHPLRLALEEEFPRK